MEADSGKRQALAAVAQAYKQHYGQQLRADFHGLRDFYALVKALCLTPQLDPQKMYSALMRNFGGPPEIVRQVGRLRPSLAGLAFLQKLHCALLCHFQSM